MEITGTQTIAAPRLAVWQALNDPDVLKRCLPGCESAERVSPDEFRIVMLAAVGPLRARFNGTLRMTEADAPSSCIMVFEGQGGPMGFGKGTSSVHLQDVAAGTQLVYSATAQIGGKLAQVGSRLIDSVARKMSDDFFTEFRRQFAADEPVPAAPPAAAPPDAVVAHADSVAPAFPAGPHALPVAATHPVPPAALSARLVPGSWLVVATILGAAIAIAGRMLGQ